MSITIERADEGWLLSTSVLVARPRDEVFPFFADARNLERLTPPFLKFDVLTEGEIPMHAGTLIDYRLSLHGIPIRWRTEIQDWDPPERFVDRQVKGPYRWWIHEHTFDEHAGGALCGDRVRYGVPGGALVHRLAVARDVTRVFEYRRARLLELFGAGRAAV